MRPRVTKTRGVAPSTEDAQARIEAAVTAIGARVASLPWRKRVSLPR